MMTGAEAAEKDANAAEATQQAAAQAAAQAVVEAVIEAEAEAKRKAEAAIDDELLTLALRSVRVTEVLFTTPISPPRETLARPITPEATAETTRKRTHTLVYRTPDKPRAAPVGPTTPLNTIVSEAQVIYTTSSKAHELPASTAPARLDGRIRREGKNSEYVRAIAIERGRGRGGRGGQGQSRGATP
jgi:hypothetical protein